MKFDGLCMLHYSEAFMTIYDLIAKWIREANLEYNLAKTDENYLKMKQIQRKIETLRDVRVKLN